MPRDRSCTWHISLFYSKPTRSLYHFFTYFYRALLTDEKHLDSYFFSTVNLGELNSDSFFPNYTISFSCIVISIGKTRLWKDTKTTMSWCQRAQYTSRSHLRKAEPAIPQPLVCAGLNCAEYLRTKWAISEWLPEDWLKSLIAAMANHPHPSRYLAIKLWFKKTHPTLI